MKKAKKFITSILVTALCITSFASATPKNADAATYCCHTIYKAGRLEVGHSKDTHEKKEYIVMQKLPFIKIPWKRTCTITTTSYRDVYACYKCSYSYMGSEIYTVVNHSLCD